MSVSDSKYSTLVIFHSDDNIAQHYNTVVYISYVQTCDYVTLVTKGKVPSQD